MIASFAGYWIAKVKSWNRFYSSIIASSPLLIKFLWDEWALSKTLKPYGTIDFKGTPQLSIKHHYPSPQSKKVEAAPKNIQFHNIRTMPTLPSTILNAKDLIEILPPTYFKWSIQYCNFLVDGEDSYNNEIYWVKVAEWFVLILFYT